MHSQLWEIGNKFKMEVDDAGRFIGYVEDEVSLDDIGFLQDSTNKFRRLVREWPDQDMDIDFGIVPGRAVCTKPMGRGRSYVSIEGTDEFL